MKKKKFKKNLYYDGSTLIQSSTPNFSSMTNSNPGVGLQMKGFGNLGNSGNSLLSGASSALGALGAVGGIVQAAKANSQIADTSEIEAQIDAQNNNIVDANDNASLLEEWSNWSPIKDDYTWREVRGMSKGQGAINTLSATGQGAMAGMQVGGPIGGIVGGVVGLGSALAGLFTGNRKAKKKAKELNAAAEEANDRALLSFSNKADNIANENMLNALSNYAANGGPLTMKYTGVMSPFGSRFANGGGLHTNGTDWDNGITFINNGGTHEENPYEGIQMGIDPQGVPNLVEEGEVIFNDYVFSNRLKPSEEMKKKNKYKGNTFADIAKNLQKESEERPNDPISKRGLEASMNKLTMLQENVRNKNNKNKYSNRYDFGSYLRYAPVLGSAIGAIQNIADSPDYSSINSIIDAANRIGKYNSVKYTPVSNYLTYRPFDRDYYTNKLNAQSGATRNAIMNTTSPSRNAALLAADYNAQTKLGDLFRQAEEYNLAQRERVENFNRATNMANSEMGLKASMANQEAKLKADSQRMSGITQAMAMKDTIDSRRNAGINANLTNLFDSLGAIGKEEFTKDMIENSPFLLYNWLGEYKGSKKSKGGYLTIKRGGK